MSLLWRALARVGAEKLRSLSSLMMLFVAVFAVSGLGLPGTAAAQSVYGAQARLDYIFPDPTGVLCSNPAVTVGDGVEFATPCLPVFAVDVTPTTVVITFNQPFNFAGGSTHNGPRITFAGTSDLSGSTVAAGSAPIAGFRTTANSVQIDFIGRFETPGSYAAGDVITINLSGIFVGLSPAITVSPSSLPNGAVAAAYSQTLTATGGTAPYSFTRDSGTLPAGLTLSTGGVLSGTPTAGGTFNFTVRATDAASQSATQAYTLTVAAPTVTATNTVPAARRGFAYSQTLTGSGGTGPYTFALDSGALPAGITLSSTGVLSGTPTVVGSFPIGVRVTDSSTGTGPYSSVVNLTLVVNAAAIAVTPTSLPSVIAGLPYEQTLSASGGAGAYSYAVTAGALPTGIILVPNGAGAGRVVGNSYTVGTFGFTVTATDAFGNTGSVALSIAVTARPDPSLDPEVRGLNSAQEDATRRLADNQIGNFVDRLENLRDGRADDRVMGIRVTSALGGGLQGGPSTGLSQRLGLAGGAETADPLRDEVAALRFAPMGLDTGDRIGASTGPVSGFGGLSLASTAIGSGDGALGASTAASNGGAQASARSGGIRLWTGGTIAVGRRSANSEQDRLSISSQGLSAGVDFAVNDRLDLGVGVGYGAEDTEVGTRDSAADTTSMVGVVYASFRPTDGVYLDAILGQGSLSFDLTRRVTVDNSLVTGERDGDMLFGSIGLGFDRVLTSGRITTYGRIDAMSADLDAYTETGSPFWALNYDAREVESLQAVLGLRYAGSRVDRDRTWRPTARAEWRQELGDGSEQTLRYADFLTGPSYQIGSTGWDRGLLDVGFGLGMDTADGWTAEVELGAQVQEDQALSTLRLMIARRF